ncbi:hypothetical protein D3C81_2212460 [compost metagenome]
MQHGLGQTEPLPIAEGERSGLAVPVIGKLKLIHNGINRRTVRDAPQPADNLHILADGKFRIGVWCFHHVAYTGPQFMAAGINPLSEHI